MAEIEAPHILVYRSTRRAAEVTWSITLQPVDSPAATIGAPQTRVLLRLRMGPIKRVWLAKSAGKLIDLLTIAGMAAGLRERVAATAGIRCVSYGR